MSSTRTSVFINPLPTQRLLRAAIRSSTMKAPRAPLTTAATTQPLRRSKRRRAQPAKPLSPTSSPLSTLNSPASESVRTDSDASDFVPSLDAPPTPDSDRSMEGAHDQRTPPPPRPRPAKRARRRHSPAAVSSVRDPAAPRAFTRAQIEALRSGLLDWYVANRRTLPWRAEPRYRPGLPPAVHSMPAAPSAPGAPYAVWISEVMSQQTRIQVVVEYFKRWMAAFPTVQHLADAELDRVNELWSGLGYYRRARFLHEGAKQIMELHGGVIPGDVPSLLKLKGIGRYTAGAISSMAFGHAEPLVDGNVERVFARLLPGLSGPVEAGSGVKAAPAVYWDVAADCVGDIECAGDFNQALMEFGALVCKPKAVLCEDCPVQGLCGAYKEAKEVGAVPAEYVLRYPIKNPKKATKVRDELVSVLVVCADTSDGHRNLVLQRPGEGLLAGLWEAPNFVVDAAAEHGEAVANRKLNALLAEIWQNRVAEESDDEVAKRADLEIEVGSVSHIFSHIRQTLQIKLVMFNRRSTKGVNLNSGMTSENVPFRWLLQHELDAGAVSTQMRKVFTAAEKKLPRVKSVRKDHT